MKTLTHVLPKLLLLLLTLCLAVAAFAACDKNKAQETTDTSTEQTGNEHTDTPHTHDYDSTGVCRICGERRPSEGLHYQMNADKAGYTVLDIGMCPDIDVVIPATYNELPVTSIEAKAFKDCSALTSITIPDSVTSIGYQAFYGCTNLTSITIPDSVKSLSGTFYGCSNLTYNIYDNAKYLGNATNPYVVLIKATSTDITSCAIHADTKVIYDEAFFNAETFNEGCTGLTSITIPNGVTSICYRAFKGCTGLTSITIPDSVTSIGVDAFSGCAHLTSITIPNGVKYINSGTFSGTGLTSITIPDSVIDIDAGAFYYCTGLTSVTIPDSVTSIGESAFYHCTGLTSITIPDSVTDIGKYAFDDCTGLTNITYQGTKAQWRAISKGSNWNNSTGAYTVHCTDGNILKSYDE